MSSFSSHFFSMLGNLKTWILRPCLKPFNLQSIIEIIGTLSSLSPSFQSCVVMILEQNYVKCEKKNACEWKMKKCQKLVEPCACDEWILLM
jgi:hypothetical protein